MLVPQVLPTQMYHFFFFFYCCCCLLQITFVVCTSTTTTTTGGDDSGGRILDTTAGTSSSSETLLLEKKVNHEFLNINDDNDSSSSINSNFTDPTKELVIISSSSSSSDSVEDDFLPPDVVTRRRRYLRTNNNNNNKPPSSTTAAAAANTRIVGGDAVKAEDGYDFFAQWFCGGVLIHTDVVLTAAHCFLPDKPEIFHQPVIVGSRNRVNSDHDGTATTSTSSSGRQEGEKRKINAYRIHPSYGGRELQGAYDLMLLRLQKPITTIQPAVLNNNPTWPLEGQSLTTMGYGYTREDDHSSTAQVLQKVQVPGIHNCSKDYPHYADRIMNNIMFCAGGNDEGKDACTGDSGGPIVDTATKVLMGTVSWGDGCAREGNPGVYTRISTARDWIVRYLCTISNDPPSYCTISNYIGRTPPFSSASSNNNNNNNNSPVLSTTTTFSASLRIDIMYDSFPNETSWTLKDSWTGLERARSNPQDSALSSANTLVKRALHNVPHGEYVFRILDKSANGICCISGAGYIKIHQILPTNEDIILNTLWELSGDFLQTLAVIVTI